MVTITPLHDRVVVRRVPEEQRTASGIYLPDVAKEKPYEGEVIAVGPGKRSDFDGERIPLDVKEGDRVLFGKYAGNEIKVEGQDYIILKEDDIMAKLGPPPKAKSARAGR